MKKTARYKVVDKTRFTAFCTSIALLTAGAVCALSAVSSKAKASEREYTVIYVGEGDTLWGIAKEYCSEGTDIRSAVSEIKSANCMTSSTIYPGDALYVPVY